jgi:hypothetical protein
VINPAIEDQFTSIFAGSKADVHKAVAAAKACSWHPVPGKHQKSCCSSTASLRGWRERPEYCRGWSLGTLSLDLSRLRLKPIAGSALAVGSAIAITGAIGSVCWSSLTCSGIFSARHTTH